MSKFNTSKLILTLTSTFFISPAFSIYHPNVPEDEIRATGRLSTDVAWHQLKGYDYEMFTRKYQYFDEGIEPDGSDIRSFRLGLKGLLKQKYEFSISFDLGKSRITTKDLYLSYKVNDKSSFKVGQFKPPISLEYMDSSLFIAFLERALPNAFVSPRRLGIGFDYIYPVNSSISLNYYAGAFNNQIDKLSISKLNQSHHFSNRLVLQKSIDKDKYWLTGGGFSNTWFNANQIIRYKPNPESIVVDFRLVDSGDIYNVKSSSLFNYEFALQYKRLSFQGEYFKNLLNRESFNSDRFEGYYGYINLFLTNNYRPFNRTASRHERIDSYVGEWGAFETSLRYSHINLNSRDIKGGTQDNISFGLNWYLNNYIRFMTNIIHARGHFNNKTTTANIYTLRAQCEFD